MILLNVAIVMDAAGLSCVMNVTCLLLTVLVTSVQLYRNKRDCFKYLMK